MLGAEGIRSLCSDMERLEINIGHVAVGGIRLEDVRTIMEAGANGVAVSGAIAFANDIPDATAKFLEALESFRK